MFKLKIYFVQLLLGACSVNCAHWNYDPNSPDGPNNWGRVSQNCDGRRQSPVNFDWFAATPILTAPRIRIQDIDKRPSSIQYTNNGHGIAVTFSYADGVQPMVTGGPLELDSYIFHSLHLHWDSEHTINGHHFPAETHLVHFNSKYGSLEQAIKQNDGLAVLGFLHHIPVLSQVPRNDNARPFFNSTINVREPGSIFLQQTNLFSLLDAMGTRTFSVWHYNGSLTTPNCNEVVNWMVHKFPIPIYPSEVRILRQIKDDKGNALSRNNRPIQILNGRRIFCF